MSFTTQLSSAGSTGSIGNPSCRKLRATQAVKVWLCAIFRERSAPPVIETKRHVIDLGSKAQPIIEVWIRQTVRGLPGPRPFLLAVAYGGSLAFATPLGHQVNLMVFGPGGYRYTDFLRLGIPLSLIAWGFLTWALTLHAGW